MILLLQSSRQGAKALSYCCPLGRRCESAFALLSHKKVTKRLWPAAWYGKIGVVGYRLLQERDG